MLDALTTLAFDYPPRADFFSSELEQYLLLTREEETVGVLKARGSYAGAMGIAQFMPGSYRYFAVDFDGDGRRDLLRNVDDAIGSVANYLKRHGWLPGEPMAVRARVSGEHYEAYVNSSLRLDHLVAQWKWLGVTPIEDIPNSERAMLFSLRTRAGPQYWLGLNNFYVITRYNRSAYYAMAVHDLGREIRVNREQQAHRAGEPALLDAPFVQPASAWLRRGLAVRLRSLVGPPGANFGATSPKLREGGKPWCMDSRPRRRRAPIASLQGLELSSRVPMATTQISRQRIELRRHP